MYKKINNNSLFVGCFNTVAHFNIKMFLFWLLFISFILSFIIVLIQLIKNRWTPVLRTPFEAGFNRVRVIIRGISLYFFNLLVVFVLFDLEIVLLLVFVYNSLLNIFIFILFFMFIIFTLYFELKFFSISWKV